MSRSEFRWNKKRKHYAYLHKDVGSRRKNILLTSKSIMIIKKNRGGKEIVTNVPLYHHPNPKKSGRYYLIPRIYVDDVKSFDEKIFQNWEFNKNDKRKLKRIKKLKRHNKK